MSFKKKSETQYLPPIDSCFRALDHSGTPQHIGALAILNGRIEKEVLTTKLVEISVNYPRMKSVFSGNSYPEEYTDPDFDFKNNIYKHEEYDDIKKILNDIPSVLIKKFNSENPLWEFHIFPLKNIDTLLFFKLHHSIGDGMSGLSLFHELFDYQKKKRKNDYKVNRANLPGTIASLTTLLHEALSNRPPLPLHNKNSCKRKINVYSVPNKAILHFKKTYNCTSFSVLLSLVSKFISDLASKQIPPDKSLNKNSFFRALVPVTIRGNEFISDLSNKIGGASVNIPLFIDSYEELIPKINLELGRKINSKAYGAYHLYAKICALFPLPIQNKLCEIAAKKTSGICTFLQAPSKELKIKDATLISEFAIPALMPEHGISFGFIKYRDQMNVLLITDPDCITDLDQIDISMKDVLYSFQPSI